MQLIYSRQIEKRIELQGNLACKCGFTEFWSFISEADLVFYDAICLTLTRYLFVWKKKKNKSILNIFEEVMPMKE